MSHIESKDELRNLGPIGSIVATAWVEQQLCRFDAARDIAETRGNRDGLGERREAFCVTSPIWRMKSDTEWVGCHV